VIVCESARRLKMKIDQLRVLRRYKLAFHTEASHLLTACQLSCMINGLFASGTRMPLCVCLFEERAEWLEGNIKKMNRQKLLLKANKNCTLRRFSLRTLHDID
jgi:hypothetical protein